MIYLLLILMSVVIAQIYTIHQRDYVQEHNIIRSNVSPPAAYMKKLIYSLELELIAQRHANSCSFDNNDHRSMQSPTFSRVGENIFYGAKEKTISDAIQYWEQQGNYYNIRSNECQTFKFCELYTQVTWADSEYIGCGKAECGTKTFIVCDYGPSSDLYSRPYTGGVSCNACPIGYMCEKNLCKKYF
ncbi:glioma pathogenesis-related protein 1-like [Ostrea edulis]|uniref:glioma pathogenesis-related protein 1-like n=1 Tax=Ostrea edulis TaxID=37623 RepID=UPI0024AF426D|nr:glioma pathogenesis-related protein 1-like [Ostrea edulis]